jgi:hypothetical protein
MLALSVRVHFLLWVKRVYSCFSIPGFRSGAKYFAVPKDSFYSLSVDSGRAGTKRPIKAGTKYLQIVFAVYMLSKNPKIP